MSDFDKAVKKAQKKLGENIQEQELPVSSKGRYRAFCAIDGKLVLDDWPTQFEVPPQKGDSVISDEGQRLQIVNITWAHSKGQTAMILELGRSITDTTPSSGVSGGDAL